ncbi:hypothetical protein Glove_20g23 [Diversispora epigaea]|uniref:Uncharacterized protein n=1 Tax=Diversispora epigaea TaxID=1348612 RepID=A0A397JPX6_9GLOM|nr:hypothetical protein Glove_20g23 [Diversispora epigaea]
MNNENQNIILKIWYLYFKWAGIWKVHKIKIRIRNHDLQQDCLVAPLFAIDNLIKIFNLQNPLEHPIFHNYTPPELNEKGFEKLSACYSNEKRNLTGRRTLGVKRTKHLEYKKTAKNKKRKMVIQTNQIRQDSELQISNQPYKK